MLPDRVDPYAAVSIALAFPSLRSERLAHLIFVVVCGLWGSSFILMKWARPAFGPVSVGAFRIVGGAMLLLAIWRLVPGDRRPTGLRRRHAPRVLFLVVVNFALPYSLQPYLIGLYGDSAFFGMFVSLVPLVTLLIAVPLVGERPTPRQIVGVLGGLVCLLALVGVGAAKRIAPADLALALLIPLAYALSNTLIKRWFSGVAPLPLTAIALSAAGLAILPVAVALEPMPGPRETPGFWPAVASLAVLGPLCTGLAIFLFYRLIQWKGPIYAGMVTYIIPLGALAWGWADGESITPLQLLALLGVLAMTALVQSAKK